MYSLSMVFSPYLILICSVGAVLGIMWAALPGLSTGMAMALLVGISFNMPTHVAITFILGVYTGSIFGGAISAILINIPGTPDAVPTMLAGHPLAKKGQGGLALGTSITASMIGNWAGIVLLIVASPWLIKVALKFSSWEIALLGFWGVSVSGTLTAGERPLKGWISGCLGLLIAMVGKDWIHGHPRFTFDNPDLLTGISFIPILIGVFGLAEVFTVLGEPQPYRIPQKVGRVLPNFMTIVRYWKSIIRSSFLGLLTGAIPGVGAGVATFVSYAVGERFTKKDFSKGDLEGVICSEVANNANIGGALLPCLTLGIPGNGGTASFLAALSLHGVVLGPLIEHDYPGMLSFIYGTLIVANIAMFVGAFALIKPSVKLFSMPKEVLLPGIVLLCIVGSFSQQLAMFDIYLMFTFGIIGYFLRKNGFPSAPLVIGVILGQMVDHNLRRALIVHSGEMGVLFSRPIGVVLMIVVILTFISGVCRKKRKLSF